MPKTKSTSGSQSKSEAPRHRYTYWLTRDSDPVTGELSPTAKLWTAAPDRRVNGIGHAWSSTFLEDLYGEWSMTECLYHARTYPDDDRQCIRVGGHSERKHGDPVEKLPV
jgi:hypothetical protein